LWEEDMEGHCGRRIWGYVVEMAEGKVGFGNVGVRKMWREM
jgi:hypothetical protein